MENVNRNMDNFYSQDQRKGAWCSRLREKGDLIRVIKVSKNAVEVENKDGRKVEFVFNCGAARLEPTEWKDDFPS